MNRVGELYFWLGASAEEAEPATRASHEAASASSPSGECPLRGELHKRAKYISVRLGHIKEPGYVRHHSHGTFTSNAILHNRDGRAAAALIAELIAALEQRA